MRRAGAIACGALLLAGVAAVGLHAYRGSAPDLAATPIQRPYPQVPYSRGALPEPLPAPAPPERTVLDEVRDALVDSYYSTQAYAERLAPVLLEIL